MSGNYFQSHCRGFSRKKPTVTAAGRLGCLGLGTTIELLVEPLFCAGHISHLSRSCGTGIITLHSLIPAQLSQGLSDFKVWTPPEHNDTVVGLEVGSHPCPQRAVSGDEGLFFVFLSVVVTLLIFSNEGREEQKGLDVAVYNRKPNIKVI